MNPGTCKHYTGFRDKDSCCDAGINYRQTFDGDTPGIMLRMPCVQYRMVRADGRGTYLKAGEQGVRVDIDRRGHTMQPCPHFQEPTPEEIEQARQERDASFARTVAGLQAAAAWRVKPKPLHDRHEVVACPICKTNTLNLWQSATNGHVHGKCATPGCVEWME